MSGQVPQTGGEPHGELRLLTITGLWRLPRKLHNLGALRLSLTGPISYRFIVYTAAVFVPALLLFHLLHLPVLGPSMFIRWVLPGATVYLALRYAANGGRPWELAWSWLAFAASLVAGAVLRLVTAGGGRPVRVRSRVMLRDRRSVAPATLDQRLHERWLEWRSARAAAAAVPAASAEVADDFDVDEILRAVEGQRLELQTRKSVKALLPRRSLVKGWGWQVQRTPPADEWATEGAWIDEVLAEPHRQQ